jgi:hypothetical protein
MSFDIYLQCFAGEPLGIARAQLRSLFPVVDEKSEPDYWNVFYDRLNSCMINVTPAKSDDELVTSIAINRPCGDVRFWDSILAILRIGPVMMYWPGGGPLVSSETFATGFPAEIIEALGQPTAVNSAQQILDAIRAS